jgi:xylulokinase
MIQNFHDFRSAWQSAHPDSTGSRFDEKGDVKTMQYILGVDLGTTAIKIALFDETGNKIADHTEEYNLLIPQPLYAEFPAERYWDIFRKAMKMLLDKSKIDRRQIDSLSISAQGETFVFLDKNDQPLDNFIVWIDRRAQEEAIEIEAVFTCGTIYKVTGQPYSSPLWPAAKILWFKRNRPDIFSKIRKIMLIEDYFFYRLGGVFYGEGSSWCSSLLWNIHTRCRWDSMLEMLGIHADQLPELRESGEKIGTILPQVGQSLGLPDDLTLVMGGLDQACGAIGVGNVKPGIFSESTGSALVAVTMLRETPTDDTYSMPCFCSAIKDLHMIHVASSGGIALKWLRDTLCDGERLSEEETGRSAYIEMDRLAATVSPGCDKLIVLPYFQGSGQPANDRHAKCTIYGLSLNHTRSHIIRAFMEGIAANISQMITAVQKCMGFEIEEIISLSGGANSPLWCQIKADITGKPLVTTKSAREAACLGAALLAGHGTGVFPSIPEAALKIVKRNNRYLPNPENRVVYDDLLAHFALLTDSLKPINKEIAL